MPQRPSAPDDLRLWGSVDRYYEGLFVGDDPVLREALAASAAAGLPDIQVSPLQGQFLGLLARAIGARRILEIGTLGGYSAICLARALPEGGHLLTLELEPRHAEVARANLARAGLQAKAEVRVGPASDSLAKLAAERAGPFDLVFIDADKPGYPAYLEAAVPLIRPGGVLVADNVVRRGDIVDPGSADPNVRGIRAMNDRIAGDPRLMATVLQTVGGKGHDGFSVLWVVPPR